MQPAAPDTRIPFATQHPRPRCPSWAPTSFSVQAPHVHAGRTTDLSTIGGPPWRPC